MTRYSPERSLEHELAKAEAAIATAAGRLETAKDAAAKATTATDAAMGALEVAQERRVRIMLAIRALTGPAVSAEGLVAAEKENATDGIDEAQEQFNANMDAEKENATKT